MPSKRPQQKSGNRFVRDDNPALRPVVRGVKELVKRIAPESRETLNSWGVPTFEDKGPFCIYMVGKNHVTLGFHSGALLEDPAGILEGTGKNIRHVKLRTKEDLERPEVAALIRAAHRFERKAPMPGMSGRKNGVRKRPVAKERAKRK
jgi:hypothetical protein